MNIVTANISHAHALGPNIREMDCEKCLLVCGYDAQSALIESLSRSSHAWTATDGDKVVAMFGVIGSVLADVGIPWLLCSQDAINRPVEFVRLSKKMLPMMVAGYESIENYVLDSNEKAKKWLRWLGFTLDAPAPYGAGKRMFRRYIYARSA